ncbi:MAG: ferredoxin-type protein NapF [Arcobacteraceae bacterium]
MKRRELFSSLFSSKEKREFNQEFIRPPYFSNEDSFHKECIKCEGKCSTVCEENIIVIHTDKTPYLNFDQSGCTFCDACAKECPFEVLSLEFKSQVNAVFEIDMLKCLSWNSTMCFSCKDPCFSNAIEFLGMFRPTINTNICTGCGFCVNICPTKAISYKKIEKEENESDL